MSHVFVTLPQDYKHHTAPVVVEVHPVTVFDPTLEMSLVAVCLWVDVCECPE